MLSEIICRSISNGREFEVQAESRYTELLEEHDKQIRKQAFEEVNNAMYHQCFECNNDEDMQKWDGGNWIRYKLFENVMKQLKEQKNDKSRNESICVSSR